MFYPQTYSMNVLITGAGKGIGYETVKEFARKGAGRILAVSRNTKKLLELKNDCNRENSDTEIYPVPYDLTGIFEKPSGFLEIVSSVTHHLDCLINNAGFLKKMDFGDFNYPDAQKIFDVNFFVPAFLIKTLKPIMCNGPDPGHVINISSMGGFQGSSKYPGMAYYSSSKAAIACLTECLSEEFKQENIVFNCLALGAVRTEMLNEAFPGYEAPLGADQMAQFIVDFAMKGARFFKGKILPVSVSNP